MDRERLIELYIGKKDDISKTKKTFTWYKDSFKRCDISKGFSWKWSWGAFFGNWLYLLYRKCYFEAISYFLLVHILGSLGGKLLPELSETISGGTTFIFILSGGLLHNVVYRRYLKSKTIAEKVGNNIIKVQEKVEELGGTDKKAVIIGFIGYMFLNFVISYVG